jgi:hypothetical protein
LQYENITQDYLFNEGKGQDEILIRSDFNKPISQELPLVGITYGDSTSDSFTGLLPDSSNTNDSTFYWAVTSLPEGSINSGNMLVEITAYDWTNRGISRDSTFNNQLFYVDNTPPALLATDTIIPMGHNAQPGWINNLADSIRIKIPIPAPATDPTLFYNTKGGVNIQIKNKNRGLAGWVTIVKEVAPLGDSLQWGNGGLQSFHRAMVEIDSAYEIGVGIVHGDTLLFRALLSDRSGNKTAYDSSATFLVYDPLSPLVTSISSGNVFTEPALVSTDVISAGWSGSVDSVYQGIPGSGIAEYSYKIMEYDTIPPTDTLTLFDWASNGLEVFVEHTELVLTPRNLYQYFITAVDSAGNGSDTISSNAIQRVNSAPIIVLFNAYTAWEDSLYTAIISVTDVDTGTEMIAVYKLSSQAVYALNKTMIGAELTRWIALDEIVSEPLPAESTAVIKYWYRFRGVKTSSVCSTNTSKPFEAQSKRVNVSVGGIVSYSMIL